MKKCHVLLQTTDKYATVALKKKEDEDIERKTNVFIKL